MDDSRPHTLDSEASDSPQPIRDPLDRADALDALRGLAVLMMIFSGLVPRKPPLPAWMYHAQVAPPDFQFDPLLPGLTWVDWVFPLFLFAMGVSIPVALSRRIDRLVGTAPLTPIAIARLLGDIARRWLELSAFAIVLQHLRPNHLSAKPTDLTWCLTLIGFGLLTLVYVRWPQSWRSRSPAWLPMATKIVGWLAIAILMAVLPFRDDTGFDLMRQDVILMLLAVSALSGSLLWLVTRSRQSWRLGALALLLALRLSATGEGWIAALWNGSPIPWLFRVEYLQYLFIVIPGTIAGDLLLRYWRDQREEPQGESAIRPVSRWRWFAIAKWLGGIVLVLLIGLQGRWVGLTTGIAIAGLAILLVALPRGVTLTARDRFRSQLIHWGAYWLILGLFCEPFQGGIHKDPPTLSYFFISTAMSLFLWVNLMILIEDFGQPFRSKRWLQLAIDNGRNPMVAYVAYANVVLPILNLTRIHPGFSGLTQAPILAIGRAIIYTLLVALLTSGLLRLKIVWRTG